MIGRRFNLIRNRRRTMRFIPLALVSVFILAGWTTASPPANDRSGRASRQDKYPLETQLTYSRSQQEYQRCDTIKIFATVHNFPTLKQRAQTFLYYFGKEGEEIVMTWTLTIGDQVREGHTVGATEKFILSAALFEPGIPDGQLEVKITVGDWTIAQGKMPVVVKIKECERGTILNYNGSYSDGFWIWRETGVMLMATITSQSGSSSPVVDTEQTAASALSLTGTGQFTFVANGTGTCVLTPPALGLTTVDISGTFEDGSGTFRLFYDIQPGTASGNSTITCAGVSTGVSPPQDYDPAVFGLGEMTFAGSGGTNSVGVSQGLSGRAGSGTLTFTVFPIGNGPAAWRQNTRVVAEFWAPLTTFLSQPGG